MPVRRGTARRRITALVASALLSAAVAVAVPEAAAAAAADDDCSAGALEPDLWTDGWTINIGGRGMGFCSRGGSAVVVLVKKDVRIFPDPTYATGVGRQGEWVFAGGVCNGNDDGNFYTEVRVGDAKEQSGRVRLDCG